MKRQRKQHNPARNTASPIKGAAPRNSGAGVAGKKCRVLKKSWRFLKKSWHFFGKRRRLSEKRKKGMVFTIKTKWVYLVVSIGFCIFATLKRIQLCLKQITITATAGNGAANNP
jgi:hypothetical protein